jgi:NAD(P)H-nitrite reductase large subunit
MLKDGEKGVIIQRDKKSYAVAPHIPCGVVSPDLLIKIGNVAKKHKVTALKITSAARIAMVGIEEVQVDQIWDELAMDKGAATGLCVRSVKVCPGTTFCKRGIRDSLGIGMKLDGLYHGLELPGKMKMGVSGCPNQCAETCIKDIALVGFGKGWKLLVGGNGGALPRLAVELAKDLEDDQALAYIDALVKFYQKTARPHQRMGMMIERMGGFTEFYHKFFSANELLRQKPA